jgi:hypothetical protein
MRLLLGLTLATAAVLALAVAVRAQGDCRLEATTKDGYAFDVRGHGFEPGEMVSFRFGLIQNEPWEIEKTADRRGSFWEGLYFDTTTPRGIYRLTAHSVSCATETTIEWPLPDTATEFLDVVPDAWRFLFVVAAGLIAFSAALRAPINKQAG